MRFSIRICYFCSIARNFFRASLTGAGIGARAIANDSALSGSDGILTNFFRAGSIPSSRANFKNSARGAPDGSRAPFSGTTYSHAGAISNSFAFPRAAISGRSFAALSVLAQTSEQPRPALNSSESLSIPQKSAIVKSAARSLPEKRHEPQDSLMKSPFTKP